MGNTHPCRPEHELKPKNYKNPYTCSGCRMQGLGKRHACGNCGYVLHDECMFPATGPIRHPFFGRSTFKFLERPAESPVCSGLFRKKCLEVQQRYCDACGKPIYGFNYHCRKKDLDLHPCCSKLKDELLVNGVKVQLRKKVSSTCRWCDKKRLRDSVSGIRGWSYVSRCGKHHFHVYCVSEMRIESWRRSGEVGDQRGDDDDALALEHINLSVPSGQDGGGRSVNNFWRIVRIFLNASVGILVGDPLMSVVSFLTDLIAQ